MRRLGTLALVAALGVTLVPVGGTAATAASDEAVLRGYAEATWRSFVAMTDESTGLPTDALGVDGTRAVQTSTTNIGAYLWSTVLADELGFITHDEALERMALTISTLETMERHAPSGQYFNWYDHRTGEKLTVWPSSGDPLTPILSSVDNGWLATGLKVVAGTMPELAG